jgi:hypothetical protein
MGVSRTLKANEADRCGNLIPVSADVSRRTIGLTGALSSTQASDRIDTSIAAGRGPALHEAAAAAKHPLNLEGLDAIERQKNCAEAIALRRSYTRHPYPRDSSRR